MLLTPPEDRRRAARLEAAWDRLEQEQAKQLEAIQRALGESEHGSDNGSED